MAFVMEGMSWGGWCTSDAPIIYIPFICIWVIFLFTLILHSIFNIVGQVAEEIDTGQFFQLVYGYGVVAIVLVFVTPVFMYSPKPDGFETVALLVI